MVTICIPAYNSEKTIAKTIDSILGQTYKNIELYVSDNHSTDNTIEIVKTYKNKGVKLVICPLPKIQKGSPLDNCHSAAQNWNSLINYGSGEYIGIYHADDIYNSTIVEKQVEIFENSPELSAVFALPKAIDEFGKLIGRKMNQDFPVKKGVFDQVGLIELLATKGSFFSTSGVMLRRDIWEKAGEFNGLQFGHALDTEFWIRISGISPVAIIFEQLVLYRISPAQDSASWRDAYRYSNCAFLPALDFYISNPEIKEKLTKDAFIHLDALKGADALRVSLNFAEDNRKSELKIWLRRIWGIPIGYLIPMYRLHERKYLAKIIIGKIWYLANLIDIGKPIEVFIRKWRLFIS